MNKRTYPFPSPEDISFIGQSNGIVKQILSKFEACRSQDVVDNVIRKFNNRLISSQDTIHMLYVKAPHNYDWDAGAILRCMYDVLLQGLYILSDANSANERAQLFEDYYWIEQHKAVEMIDSNPSLLSKRLTQSSRRSQNEPEIQKKFSEVEVRCHTKKGKLRKHWYPQNDLHEIAKDVGYEDEYRWLQLFLSGDTHTGPFSALHGGHTHGFQSVYFAGEFVFRFLGAASAYFGCQLDETEQKIVGESKQSVIDREWRTDIISEHSDKAE